jgi:hypothetical protein
MLKRVTRAMPAEQVSGSYPPLYVNWATQFGDWVWDVLPLSAARVGELVPSERSTGVADSEEGAMGAYLVVGFAHNRVEVWHWRQRRRVHAAQGEPCILYVHAHAHALLDLI